LAAEQQTPPDWLGEVKGLVTLGSPIDKHHLIWGENFPRDISKPKAEKIKWWNFWDYSDPVGHSLDGIFGRGCMNNQFERVFDAGYWRYPIPGKAHVDYWTDINLHHKIIQEVMEIPAEYKPGQMEVADKWWGRWKLPRPGDFAAYGVARGMEVVALLYFLSHLLNPIRDWMVQKWPFVAPWLDRAESWPSTSGFVLKAQYVNIAIWTLGAAWIWKFIWDIGLLKYQDEKLNLERQLRRERWAMILWGVVLIYASLNIGAPPAQDIKDYLGWATGLVTTALVWKLHTAVHKGLVQLWRYGLGIRR
jgi:hypothetical protein